MWVEAVLTSTHTLRERLRTHKVLTKDQCFISIIIKSPVAFLFLSGIDNILHHLILSSTVLAILSVGILENQNRHSAIMLMSCPFLLFSVLYLWVPISFSFSENTVFALFIPKPQVIDFLKPSLTKSQMEIYAHNRNTCCCFRISKDFHPNKQHLEKK